MKKLKRIVSLAIVWCMMMTTCHVFADTYTDVNKDHDHYMAIETFSNLGLLKGYEDGSFKADKEITRAEFTALVVRVMGLGDIAGLTGLKFPDVKESHWAYSNIKLAYDMNLISGFPDGTFQPDENVTYEQAVKMIVCALGYGTAAEGMGGYPIGYIAQASSLGILDNANVDNRSNAANRGIVAQILYNSLEVPLAESYDETSEPVSRTFLKDYLKLSKVTGIIEGNSYTNITGGALAKKGNVFVDDKQMELGNTYQSYSKRLGYRVIVYYQPSTVRGQFTVRSMMQQPGENRILSVDAKDIAYKNGAKFQYWKDSSHTTMPIEMSVPQSAKIIYNMKMISYSDLISQQLIPDTGSMNFIDSDLDGVYDVVEITSQFNMIVKLVSGNIIYNELDVPKIYTVPQDDSFNTVEIFERGRRLSLNELKKDDVLSVISSLDGSYCRIYVSREVASGKITMVSDQKKVTINGNEYPFSPELKNYLEKHHVNLLYTPGNTVLLYLNTDGQIVWYSTNASPDRINTYGYLITAGAVDGIGKKVSFKIFSDNKVTVYNGAKNIKIDGLSNLGPAEILSRLADTAKQTNKDLMDPADPNLVTKNDLENAKYSQIVKFSVNEDQEVTQLDTIATEAGEPEDALKMPERSVYEKQGLKYSSSARNFANKLTVNTATKVIFVPTNRLDEDSYSQKSISSFVNNKSYVLESFDLSVTKIGKVVVLYGASDDNKITVSSPLIIVKSVIEEVVNNEPVQKLTGLTTSGTTVTYYTDQLGVLDELKTGQVVRFGLNALGKITGYNPISLEFDPNTYETEPPAIPIPGISNYNQPLRYKEYDSSSCLLDNQGSNFAAYYRTLFATVVGADETSILVSTNLPTEDVSIHQSTYSVDSSTKFIVFDREQLGETAIQVVSSSEGLATLLSYTDVGKNATQLFAYSSEGRLKFVYIMK